MWCFVEKAEFSIKGVSRKKKLKEKKKKHHYLGVRGLEKEKEYMNK